MFVDVGGGPTSGAGSSASNTRGNWSSPTRRRSVSTVSGGSGKRSSTKRAIAEVPRLAWRTSPGTSAMSGRSTQMPTSTPTTPGHGAGRPGRPSARSRPGSVAWSRAPDEQPERLADERRAEQDAER